MKLLLTIALCIGIAAAGTYKEDHPTEIGHLLAKGMPLINGERPPFPCASSVLSFHADTVISTAAGTAWEGRFEMDWPNWEYLESTTEGKEWQDFQDYYELAGYRRNAEGCKEREMGAYELFPEAVGAGAAYAGDVEIDGVVTSHWIGRASLWENEVFYWFIAENDGPEPYLKRLVYFAETDGWLAGTQDNVVCEVPEFKGFEC